MMMYQTFPKVELHLHLDGSMRIQTACELLQLKEETVKEKMEAPISCDSLTDYLQVFDLPISLLQTKENLTRVTKELGEDLKQDGVIYAEVRFCPLLHIQKGLTPQEVIDAVLEGISKAPVKMNLILCMMRHFSLEQNQMIIKLAQQYHLPLDLAGDEAKYPTEQFSSLFSEINQYHIPFTIHAGESGNINSLQAAFSFQAKRIGHGIHVVNSELLLQEADQQKIHFEICPTSNIQTKAVSSYEKHPIAQLYKMGYSLSINTDNRTVSHITLSEEYEKLAHTFHWNQEDFKKINCNAIDVAFLSEEEKEKLKAIIKAV